MCKSCYGLFMARTKRGKREGSRWFGETSAGKQREKGIKGSAACLAVPAPERRCLSCLLPERCFQPFLNMNKDASNSLNNSGFWMSLGKILKHMFP